VKRNIITAYFETPFTDYQPIKTLCSSDILANEPAIGFYSVRVAFVLDRSTTCLKLTTQSLLNKTRSKVK